MENIAGRIAAVGTESIEEPAAVTGAVPRERSHERRSNQALGAAAVSCAASVLVRVQPVDNGVTAATSDHRKHLSSPSIPSPPTPSAISSTASSRFSIHR